LDALLGREDSVQIVSGRPNRAKLLYKLPAGVEPLRSRQLWKQDGRAALELRCATEDGLTVQDVLPPSIHPDTGRPYEWRGNWRNLPDLPVELLTLWRSEPQRGPREERRAREPSARRTRVGGASWKTA
jgi:hypothetical protein